MKLIQCLWKKEMMLCNLRLTRKASRNRPWNWLALLDLATRASVKNVVNRVPHINQQAQLSSQLSLKVSLQLSKQLLRQLSPKLPHQLSPQLSYGSNGAVCRSTTYHIAPGRGGREIETACLTLHQAVTGTFIEFRSSNIPG